ncbi:MAG: trypsin-like peptidase domain-containing protein [Polyangia bacterium]
MHVLRPQLFSRLSPEAKGNASSLVLYKGGKNVGSGVIIGGYLDARGATRALVLTNHHVVRDNHDDGTWLGFADGSRAGGSRILTHSAGLDYALLDVEVPSGAQISVARTSRSLPAQGTHTYTIGAATSMVQYPLEGFVAGGLRLRKEIADGIASQTDGTRATISSGQVRSAQPYAFRFSDGKRALSIWGDSASAAGSSGGPVFDAKTNELTAIHIGGERDAQKSTTRMSPTALILRDLQKKVDRNQLTGDDKLVVESLLQR